MLTSHLDAYISRSGDFRADNRRQTKLIALPLVHARGVISTHHFAGLNIHY